MDHTPTPRPNRRTTTAGGSSPFKDGLLDFSPRRRAASELDTPCPVSHLADEDIDTVMLEKLALGDDHIEDYEMLGLNTSHLSSLDAALNFTCRYGDTTRASPLFFSSSGEY